MDIEHGKSRPEVSFDLVDVVVLRFLFSRNGFSTHVEFLKVQPCHLTVKTSLMLSEQPHAVNMSFKLSRLERFASRNEFLETLSASTLLFPDTVILSLMVSLDTE